MMYCVCGPTAAISFLQTLWEMVQPFGVRELLV